MQLLELKARNIKSLNNVSFGLHDAAAKREQQERTSNRFTPLVILIYGPNGSGKSTLLEAMSMIGHLPCMARIRVSSNRSSIDVLPSVLCEQLKLSSAPTDIPAGFTAGTDLEEYFASQPLGRNKNIPGWVWLHLRLDDPTVEIRLLIRVARPIYQEHQAPTEITSLLAGKDHTDEDAHKHFAVIYDSETIHVDRFISSIFYARSYTLRNKDIWDPRRETLQPASDDDVHAVDEHAVSYLNTDLNDFGRGNDLRESPKDLARDFVEVVHRRLAIPFDGPGGSCKYVDELRSVLDDVISPPQDLFPEAGVVRPRFELVRCCIVRSQQRLRLELCADRHDGMGEFSVDYLSSGENEAFFLFLILIGQPQRRKLVLLDEPDMHISTAQKEIFYDALFRVAMRNQFDLIVATHSMFPVMAAGKLGKNIVVERKVLWRDEKENGGTLYCSDRRSFFLGLCRVYLRMSIASLNIVVRNSPLIPLQIYMAVSSNIPDAVRPIFHVNNAVIILGSILAIVADNFVPHEWPLHGEIASGVKSVTITSAVTTVGMFVFSAISRIAKK